MNALRASEARIVCGVSVAREPSAKEAAEATVASTLALGAVGILGPGREASRGGLA